MNFEEMIEARNAQKTTKVLLPYGYFYKRQIDGKYSNFVEFHDELADNIYFANSVKNECEFVKTFNHKAQLHFTPNEGDDGVYAIAVEVGYYLTLAQLLNDDPSIVARNEFINKVLNKITLFGAIYLGVIAVVPIIIGVFSTTAANSGISLGGTSIIIVVGVALETVRALEAQMLMRNYKGFLD